MSAPRIRDARRIPREPVNCYVPGCHSGQRGSSSLGDRPMDNDVISRREFGTVTAGASIGLLAPTQSLAATVGSGAPVNYSRGLIESPPTYYEVLEPIGGAKKPPFVLFPFAAHTRTFFLA